VIGGSADLNPSTLQCCRRWVISKAQSESLPTTRSAAELGLFGRNYHFGVREHGMGRALNGIAAHGGIIPFGSTFLIFSDYMRPPIGSQR